MFRRIKTYFQTKRKQKLREELYKQSMGVASRIHPHQVEDGVDFILYGKPLEKSSADHYENEGF